MQVIISLFLLLVSCTQLQRTQDSGYAPSKMTTLNKGQSDKMQLLSEKGKLQVLENSLNTKKEIEQYSKFLPWFESDSEKIEFLSLNNFEERQNWLNSKNFFNRPQTVNSNMEELVQTQDIAVGMPQALVRKSWGDPDSIEVSGNPQFRNERWRYQKYSPSQNGYKAEKKLVYFEGGKVVGWELE